MGPEASLNAWEVDPPMGSSRGRTLGRCARSVVVSYRDPASSSPLSSSSPETSRGRTSGRLLEREPVEALLATTLLQRLLLEGLPNLMLLGSVLLLLLGHQEVSSLPGDPIFRDRRPCFLNRR
jgi:hypothetical protein